MNDKIKKIANFLSKRNLSLVHNTILYFPSDDSGILSFSPKFIPVSHFGKLKKKLLIKLREELSENKIAWKDKISKIWDKELEIIIIYCLGAKYSSTDIDNLNKFIIDAMKGILFKNDSQIKLIISRKDKSIEKYLKGKPFEKAIIRIDLFDNSKINKELDNIFINKNLSEICKN